jgi:hypothetical protein
VLFQLIPVVLRSAILTVILQAMTPCNVVGDYQSVGESTDFSTVKEEVVSTAKTSSL